MLSIYVIIRRLPLNKSVGCLLVCLGCFSVYLAVGPSVCLVRRRWWLVGGLVVLSVVWLLVLDCCWFVVGLCLPVGGGRLVCVPSLLG